MYTFLVQGEYLVLSPGFLTAVSLAYKKALSLTVKKGQILFWEYLGYSIPKVNSNEPRLLFRPDTDHWEN